MREYIYNHDSEENAYVIENYPWGFRLKTQQKIWIESNKRGARVVRKTKNPKTGSWCKEKKSTYSHLRFLFIEDGKVYSESPLNQYSGNKQERIEAIIKTHGDNLTPIQRDSINSQAAIDKVLSKLDFTCKHVKTQTISFTDILSKKPHVQAEIERQELRKKEKSRQAKIITKAINYEYANNKVC